MNKLLNMYMEITELSILNYIRDNKGEMKQVFGIDRDRVRVSDIKDLWVNINDIDPVTCTPEILKRFGFKETVDSVLGEKVWEGIIGDKTSPFSNWFSITIRNSEYTNSIDRFWCFHADNNHFETVGSGDFEYIHQLQNAIKSICGVGLED